MTDLNDLLAKANQHYGAGEFKEAASLFGEIIPQAPEQFKGKLELQRGVSLFNCGDHAGALDSFQGAIDSKDVEVVANALAGKARVLEREGRFEEACDAYEQCLGQENGGQFAKWAELAGCCNQANQHERALDAAAKGLTAQPETFDKLHNARIVAFFRLGRPLEALEDVEGVLQRKAAAELRPEEVQLYCEVLLQEGQRLLTLGQAQEAEKRFQRAKDVSDSAQSWFLLGICSMRQGQDQEALRRLEKTLELDQAHWRARVAAGMLRMKQGPEGYEEAVRLFRAAQELSADARSADVDFNLGFALYSLQRTAEAKAPLSQVRQKDPTHWRSAALLGMMALQEEDWAQAAECLGAAVDCAGEEADATLVFNLAYALMMLQRFEEARDGFRRAFQMDPSNAGAKEAADRMQREHEAEELRLNKEQQERQELEEKQQQAEKQRQEAEARAEQERDQEQRQKQQQLVEQAKQQEEEAAQQKKIQKQQAKERRRKRLEELRVLVGQPQTYRARRPSLDLIPTGNTEKNATAYATWYNEKIVDKE